MATLTSSAKSVKDTNVNLTSTGKIYASYTTSETDTTFTISGTMYEQIQKDQTNFIAEVTNNSTNVSATNGTATKSFTKKLLTLGNTGKGPISTSVGTFSITIPKTTAQQSITFTISATLLVSSYITDGTGNVSGSVTLTVPALQSWPVTYYSNNGTSASQVQSKYYGVALTLAPTDPIFDGYTLKGWATSSADAAAGTVTWEKGDTYSTNAALDLYAVWELNYSKPAITNLTVERCTSNGTLDDEGQYAKVSFDWSVFRTNTARYYGGSTAPYSSNSVDSCTITVGSKTLSPTLSGASGTVNAVVGDGSFDTDTQYNVSVSITDSQAIEVDHTTTITGIMATTYYPLDFNSDATTMGVFRPAPDNGNGAYFGKDIHVDDDIEADRDIKAGRNLVANGNIISQSMAGVIQMFAGSTEPTGWLFCDGSEYLKTDYPILYSVIGDTYGTVVAPTDSDHFRVPDFQGRVGVGMGESTAIGHTAHTLGQEDGQETVQLTSAESGLPAHTHSFTQPKIPNHYHNMGTRFSDGSGSDNAYQYSAKRKASSRNTNTDGGGGACTGGAVGAVSGGAKDASSAHTNMPPFIVINYIIATGEL